MKKTLAFVTLALLVMTARRASAQRVMVSKGEVSRPGRVDTTRLVSRIPGVEDELRARMRVSGDSAQRIAMHDFEWKGRVSSVEIDEDDARVYWDVKIVPDTSAQMIVRYRVDATNGGILSIKEFTGIPGLARRRP